MSTITPEQEQKIIELIERAHLPVGVGDEANPCSVAAINLALTNELTDRIPECMSEVVGKWIIRIQDAMPDDMRNSVEWKRLLPQAAGTGRWREEERLNIILDWMWGTVLPLFQPVADEKGFGVEWARMLNEHTEAAAAEAARAAWAAWAARDAAGAAARAAAEAAEAAAEAAEAAAEAAAPAAWAAWAAAEAAAWAAWDAARAAAGAARADCWQTVDPPRLLAKLVAVGV